MADSDDITEALVENLKAGGIKSESTADGRRVDYHTPAEIIEAAQLIASSQSSIKGPFRKVRFVGK